VPPSSNYSLQEYYDTFNKFILLAQSYSQIPELSFIIKSCRFKSSININTLTRFVVHKKWIDEYSNSINIFKKRITVDFNNISIDRKYLLDSDLYSGLKLEKVIKISTLCFMALGKDDDLDKNCCLLSFYGIDNFFRTFLLLQDRWQKVSPILMGISNLKKIHNNLNIKTYVEIKNKENILPCEQIKSWLCYLPASRDFIKTVEDETGFDLTILRG
jgi:hypothetical protein